MKILFRIIIFQPAGGGTSATARAVGIFMSFVAKVAAVKVLDGRFEFLSIFTSASVTPLLLLEVLTNGAAMMNL